MVVGGFPNSAFEVEVIDLEDSVSAPCTDYAPATGIDGYAVGEFVDGLKCDRPEVAGNRRGTVMIDIVHAGERNRGEIDEGHR